MSLTSYQTALPRNRGGVVYDNWLWFAKIADTESVKLRTPLDVGWLYLFCGLILTFAAIILPAQLDLQELQVKKDTIKSNSQDLESRIGVHISFLHEVNAHNPSVTQRLIDMQFNETPVGIAVVTDKSAPSTPLAWVSQRAKKKKVLPMDPAQSSILTSFVAGQGRLWVMGVGVFSIFIGLITSKPTVPIE